MPTTTVTNYLLGGTNRGKHPATMGAEWSCNMYMETSGNTSYLQSLPGIKYLKNVGSGRCRGAYVSSVGLGGNREDAFVVMGSGCYRINVAHEVEFLGYVANGSGRVSFSETGGIRPFLLIADGSNLWAYNLLEGGPLVQATLPQRVTGDGGTIQPTHVSTVSGSVCVNDAGSGFVYYTKAYCLNSEKRKVYDIVGGEVQYEDASRLKVKTVEVDALDYMFLDDYGTPMYFSAETSSDAIQAIQAIGGSLYLFGSKTVEIWQRGSGEYETWVRTSYTTNASNGIQCPYSIATCGSTLFYLGSGESFAKGIMKVEGTSYKKISDDWLEAKLLEERSDTVYAFSYAVGSHVFYVLHLPTVGECWCYDVDTQLWHQRVSRDSVSGVEIQWRVAAMLWFDGRFLAFCHDGNMYSHSEDYFFEDYGDEKSIPMTRHRQGAVIVDNNRPFIFNELAIECNVGTWEDWKVSPQMLLEVSADGGNTFGNVRSCSLGKSGQYSRRVRFYGLGLNRLCVLRVSYSHPTALELTSVSQRITPTRQAI